MKSASTMTFDLFGEGAPEAAPAPAARSYTMEPTGTPNQWRYRGVLLGCDMARAGFIDHWFTLERIDGDLLRSDRRVALCRLIDAAANKTGTP